MTAGVCSETLEQAFRATTYRVVIGDRCFDLRIGCRHPELDVCLKVLNINQWAIVTACNPGGVVHTDSENKIALDTLRARVDALDLVHYSASNHADAWPVEYGLFLCDVSPEFAGQLALQFGQLACVVGARGEDAALRWTPRQRLG